jgi:hypothetical protein
VASLPKRPGHSCLADRPPPRRFAAWTQYRMIAEEIAEDFIFDTSKIKRALPWRPSQTPQCSGLPTSISKITAKASLRAGPSPLTAKPQRWAIRSSSGRAEPQAVVRKSCRKSHGDAPALFNLTRNAPGAGDHPIGVNFFEHILTVAFG